jgi:DnaJ-class molecular chaperone
MKIVGFPRVNLPVPLCAFLRNIYIKTYNTFAVRRRRTRMITIEPMRDYNEFYVFLNASPLGSQADIERAYQAVIGEARRQGGIMLHLVNEAYHCLSDPATRAQYHAGTYRPDVRVSILRESNDREGRTAQFDAFPRMKKIQFYQYIFDSDEVNVTFEMLPNGKFRNTKTGEIVDQI